MAGELFMPIARLGPVMDGDGKRVDREEACKPSSSAPSLLADQPRVSRALGAARHRLREPGRRTDHCSAADSSLQDPARLAIVS